MKSFPWLLPLADVCLNLMLVFAVLLRLSVAAANSTSVPVKSSISTHALYVIKVEWSGDSRDDVDSYVRDPMKNLVFFRRLSAGLMVLDHDDTGKESNAIVLPNGEKVVSAFNSEMIEIRGIVPGEWITNVHLYAARDPNPISVSVELDKVSGGSNVKVHDESVILKERGDEVTAFRFTLDKDGNVYNINRLQTKFVGTGETQP